MAPSRTLRQLLPLALATTLAAPAQTAFAAEPARSAALRACPEDMSRLLAQDLGRRRAVDTASPIDISSDDASVDVGGDAKVKGRVQLRQGDRQLSADEVRVDTRSNGVDVSGNVRYQDPELRVTGKAGHY